MVETVVAVAHDAATVRVWFGSASQETVPLDETLMNLYETTAPAANSMVTDHSGFDEAYWLALSSTALLVSQLPRAAVFPTILIVSPHMVVTISLNVTRTEEAGAQPVPVGAVPVVVAVAVL